MAEMADDEDAAPWKRPPSEGAITAHRWPLPDECRRCSRRALRRSLVTSRCSAVKRIAAFENPEFYKKQCMRLSTALTSRVISCAEDLPQYFALPRGCRTDLEELLYGLGVALDVVDERGSGEPLALTFLGTLTPVQDQSACALLASDCGVLVAPPGIGKTVIGTYLVAARACSTLVLMHRKPLLDQWRAQLAVFLGVGARKWQIGAEAQPHRQNRRRDDPEPGARNPSRISWPASGGSSWTSATIPAVSFERVWRRRGAVRRWVDRDAASTRWAPSITQMQLGRYALR
jgi:hypothetical protein